MVGIYWFKIFICIVSCFIYNRPMQIINNIAAFITFALLSGTVIVSIFSNIHNKKPIDYGFTYIFIATIFAMLSIFINNIINSQYLLLFILKQLCYIFLIYGYLKPIYAVIIGAVKSNYALATIILITLVASISIELNHFTAEGKVFFIVLYLILFISPIPFIFNFKWKSIPQWVDFPFFYPISIFIILLAFLAQELNFTLQDTTTSFYSFLQIILFLIICFLHLKTTIKRLLIPAKISIHISKYNLTPRETEITKLLMNAKSYKEISEQLNISIKTVNTHIYNIYKKCKVENKIELIKLITNS